MINITLDGSDDAVQVKLKALLSAIDTTAILDEAGAFLLNRIRTRFLREEAPDGTKWIPSAAAIKRRSHGGTGTLFDTGRLFRSIQYGFLNENQRTIGSDVEYGKHHQWGTDHMPQRVFLGFNQEDADLLGQLLIKRIEGALS